MANKTYPIAKQRLLEWASGLSAKPVGTADLYICGVTSAYVYNDAHENISSLSGIVAPETVLTGEAFTNGVVTANNPTIAGMTVGQTLDALVVYFKWAADDLLLCYMDTPEDGTLPQVINSVLGLIAFDNDGIFEL